MVPTCLGVHGSAYGCPILVPSIFCTGLEVLNWGSVATCGPSTLLLVPACRSGWEGVSRLVFCLANSAQPGSRKDDPHLLTAAVPPWWSGPRMLSFRKLQTRAGLGSESSLSLMGPQTTQRQAGHRRRPLVLCPSPCWLLSAQPAWDFITPCLCKQAAIKPISSTAPSP